MIDHLPTSNKVYELVLQEEKQKEARHREGTFALTIFESFTFALTIFERTVNKDYALNNFQRNKGYKQNQPICSYYKGVEHIKKAFQNYRVPTWSSIIWS